MSHTHKNTFIFIIILGSWIKILNYKINTLRFRIIIFYFKY